MQRVQINIRKNWLNKNYRIRVKKDQSLELDSPKPKAILDQNHVKALNDVTKMIREMFDRRPENVDSLTLKGNGSYLFKTLFQTNLLDNLTTTLLQAQKETPLKLALSLPESLAAVWWELLYSNEAIIKGFLSATSAIHFSRYTGQLLKSYHSEPLKQLRICVVTAQAEGEKKLNIRKETEIIQTALAGLSRIKLTIANNVSVKDFKALLALESPHIVHFIGHASFSHGGKSHLVFRGKDGQAEKLTCSQLMRIIRRNRSECKLIVLNACETATLEETYNNSLVGSLVKVGIPAVIGMQCSILDPIALFFSQVFYTYLLNEHCQPVDFALSQTRAFLYQDDIARNLLRRYWCAPVLYTRSQDGILFTLEDAIDTLPFLDTIRDLLTKLRESELSQDTQRYLGEIINKGRQAIPILAMLLHSTDQRLRLIAVQALKAIGTPIVYSLFRERISYEKAPEVKAEIDDALITQETKRSYLFDNDIQDKDHHRTDDDNDETGQSSSDSHKKRGAKNIQVDILQHNAVASTRIWESVQYKFKNQFSDLHDSLEDIENQVSAFRTEFIHFRNKSNATLRAGKKAISGLRTLKRWSFQSPITRRFDPVSGIVERTNKNLEKWNTIHKLDFEVMILHARYKTIERNIQTYQNESVRYGEALRSLEKLAVKVDRSTGLSWNMQHFALNLSMLNIQLSKLGASKALQNFDNDFNRTRRTLSKQIEDFGTIEIEIILKTNHRIKYTITTTTKKTQGP